MNELHFEINILSLKSCVFVFLRRGRGFWKSGVETMRTSGECERAEQADGGMVAELNCAVRGMGADSRIETHLMGFYQQSWIWSSAWASDQATNRTTSKNETQGTAQRGLQPNRISNNLTSSTNVTQKQNTEQILWVLHYSVRNNGPPENTPQWCQMGKYSCAPAA